MPMIIISQELLPAYLTKNAGCPRIPIYWRTPNQKLFYSALLTWPYILKKNLGNLNNKIRHLDNIKAFILSPWLPQQWQFPAAFWHQKPQRLLFVSSLQNKCSQGKQRSQRKWVLNIVIHLSTYTLSWDMCSLFNHFICVCVFVFVNVHVIVCVLCLWSTDG